VDLATVYCDGRGVEKDEEKAVCHYEKAAISGHPIARAGLAAHEMEIGRHDRAAKHFTIAANLGCDTSLQLLKDFFG
jgi:TPR repeat protein